MDMIPCHSYQIWVGMLEPSDSRDYEAALLHTRDFWSKKRQENGDLQRRE